ncbi:MAG: hypothetical protein CM1200mP18_20670 [Gammaproteobacteria bacterium]|nr:MAG: hypothetical protein CM1200mP18_20670 [Gammaproteobacteria bacterium]
MGLTRAMSREWGRYKVNVNAVAFGLVHTRLTQALDTDAASIDIEGHEIPVGVQRQCSRLPVLECLSVAVVLLKRPLVRFTCYVSLNRTTSPVSCSCAMVAARRPAVPILF